MHTCDQPYSDQLPLAVPRRCCAILPWIYAQVMETANRATDVAATQRLVQNFAKQSYELDAKHEMMGEAIDGLDDLDDLEDEMD